MIDLAELRELQRELAGRRAAMIADAEGQAVTTRWARRPMLAPLFRELLYKRLGERPPRVVAKRPAEAGAELCFGEHDELLVLKQFDAGVLTAEWVVSGDVGALYPVGDAGVTVARRVRAKDGTTAATAWYLAETAWGREAYERDGRGLVTRMEVVTASPRISDEGTRVNEWLAVYTVERTRDGAIIRIDEESEVRPSSGRG